MPLPEPDPRPLTERLLWFVALWAGGVGTVAVVGYAIKLWIASK